MDTLPPMLVSAAANRPAVPAVSRRLRKAAIAKRPAPDRLLLCPAPLAYVSDTEGRHMQVVTSLFS